MNEQFEKAKDLYQHRLYSFAFYSLRDREDAEDVTQEALLRLWQHWNRIDEGRLHAWLMQVTHNLVIDQLRRRQQGPAGEAEPDELADGEPASEDELFQNLFRRIVAECIARLGDPYRTVVILRDIQGCSYREIAGILAVSVDQVKTELFRGRRKLRGLVKRHRLYSPDLLAEQALRQD